MDGGAWSGPYSDLSKSVIGAAIEVQRLLGPWLLESAYEACLAHELILRGHQVKRQVPIPIRYKALDVPGAFRMDLVVDEILVIELKVVDALRQEHEAQLLSYLRFSGLPVGLLLNFAAQPLGKKGLKRLLMDQAPPPFSSSSVSSV